MEKAVVLVSGGMDSAGLLGYVRRGLGVKEAHVLSFLYGQKHSREVEMARRQADLMGARVFVEADMSVYGRLAGRACALIDPERPVTDMMELTAQQLRRPPTYAPNRNMVFLAVAAAYAESAGVRDVFYGAHSRDRHGYWDCTAEFVERMNKALRLNRAFQVSVHAPFASMSKADALKVGLALGVDYANTWTCYRGGDEPCRRCPSCEERGAAFAAAGVADPCLAARRP